MAKHSHLHWDLHKVCFWHNADEQIWGEGLQGFSGVFNVRRPLDRFLWSTEVLSAYCSVHSDYPHLTNTEYRILQLVTQNVSIHTLNGWLTHFPSARGDRANKRRRMHELWFEITIFFPPHAVDSSIYSADLQSVLIYVFFFPLCTSLAKLCAYAARRTVLNLIGKNWKAGQAWDGRTV